MEVAYCYFSNFDSLLNDYHFSVLVYVWNNKNDWPNNNSFGPFIDAESRIFCQQLGSLSKETIHCYTFTLFFRINSYINVDSLVRYTYVAINNLQRHNPGGSCHFTNSVLYDILLL